MKVLTDTHTLVWALSSPEVLGSGARSALSSQPYTASVANLWELVLKAQKPGAMVLEPVAWWTKYVIRPGIPTLAIRINHVRAFADLPEIHKDPFDRILVAQAFAEHLTIASKDGVLKSYGVPTVWD